MTKETASLIGVPEASRLSGRHHGTIYRWVEKGLLKPAVKRAGVTSAILLKPSDVLAVAAERADEKRGRK